MYHIESVVFHRNEMTLKQAKEFLHRHGFKEGRPDITTNTYRFRQMDPHKLERQGYKFRTKRFPGGLFLIAYKE
jgi:hypothetical protein